MPHRMLSALAVLSFAVPSATAQPVDDFGESAEESSIHFTARGGYIDPLGSDVGFVGRSGLELPNGAVAGIAIDMDLPVRWLAFRFTADRTLGMELLRHGIASVPCGAGTCERPTTDLVPSGIGVARWTLAGDVVFQPAPKTWMVRPYGFLGSGVKRYDYDLPRGVVEEPLTGLHDRLDGDYHFGGGFDLRVAGYTLRSEIGFYSSERHLSLPLNEPGDSPGPVFQNHVLNQSDVQYTVGLRVPVR